ncbi:hypothetical protein ACHAQA_009782 [Verticillium albo-atrum]
MKLKQSERREHRRNRYLDKAIALARRLPLDRDRDFQAHSLIHVRARSSVEKIDRPQLSEYSDARRPIAAILDNALTPMTMRLMRQMLQLMILNPMTTKRPADAGYKCNMMEKIKEPQTGYSSTEQMQASYAEEFLQDTGDDISEEELNSDNPPGNGKELIFPANISGFSIQDKKWKVLLVDHIEPVTWNTRAFERLVLRPTAKELIQAVVQVHLEHHGMSDLMEGKGNGSLILLHGPPGTGKTLTAESVAELVKRPLYRVTCGDVGTDPESVENYLESVLYIAKIWGCVVLMDEADVFLEERTLTDLHRNALVSVFLRVLEYYEGILILTSNRVGTFDEAFKSRIKLALHYTTLGKADRRKIWRNFFKMLKETGSANMDFDDLDDHLDDLADVKLNGRSIRNAISVARELAQFRNNEKLGYHHIKHVIGVGEEFEEYLDTTHGHKTDDWLKENGIRA